MDKDRIAGSIREAKGAIKEKIGKVAGDAKLQSDGKIEMAVGKLQNAIGGAADIAREAAKKVVRAGISDLAASLSPRRAVPCRRPLRRAPISPGQAATSNRFAS